MVSQGKLGKTKILKNKEQEKQRNCGKAAAEEDEEEEEEEDKQRSREKQKSKQGGKQQSKDTSRNGKKKLPQQIALAPREPTSRPPAILRLRCRLQHRGYPQIIQSLDHWY